MITLVSKSYRILTKIYETIVIIESPPQMR